MKFLGLLMAFCLCLASSPVYADDGVDSRINVKVNKAKRHQAMKDLSHDDDDEDESADNGKADLCKELEVGTVHVGRGPAPREVTTVVVGDVINVPSRKCQ